MKEIKNEDKKLQTPLPMEEDSVLMPDYEDDALMLHTCDSPSTDFSGGGGYC